MVITLACQVRYTSSTLVTRSNAESSSGRTADFESVNLGSNPSSVAKLASTSGQVVALSRRSHGFESRSEYHLIFCRLTVGRLVVTQLMQVRFLPEEPSLCSIMDITSLL